MLLVRGIPVYWAVETDAPDRTFITRATLHEVLPPFRLSTHAFRIRISHRHWLHVGLYSFDKELRRYGLAATPEEIGQWGKDAQAAIDLDDDSGGATAEGEAARQVERVRPLHLVGGGDDAKRGTDTWIQSHRTGSGLGAEPDAGAHEDAVGMPGGD